MEYTKTAYSIYYLRYHVVWVCKSRRRILKPGVCIYIRKLIPKLIRSMPGVTVETIGIDGDHVHLVMSIPPRYSISEVMGRLKSQSSSALRRKYTWLPRGYWKENMIWSPGYFVSSVGVDEETIKQYVEHQGFQDSCQLRMKLQWPR